MNYISLRLQVSALFISSIEITETVNALTQTLIKGKTQERKYVTSDHQLPASINRLYI